MALLFGNANTLAGVTTDGSMGAAQTLAGPSYIIGSALGQTVGNNLFHSFGQFSLQGGQSATFTGPANIANVISRVTGGAASTITGQINVGIAGANFYFLNPAGIIFNNGAQLNVPGSVVFSTANGMRMADGATFGTLAADLATSSANPAALIFSGSPAAISVLGASLAAAKGQQLALVGGDTKLDTDPAANGSTASLNAPSGNIAVISLAGGSSFSVTLPDYNVPGVAPLGNITLANGSKIISSEANGDTTGAGQIRLVGNRIDATGTEIRAETINGNSGGVVINANTVSLDNTAINTATIGGSGNAGAITINAGTIDILNNSQIDSSSDPVDRNNPAVWSGGGGLGGDITLTASSRVSLAGCVACGVPTAIVSNAFGTGKAGNISIASDQDINLNNYAVVQSDSYGPGNAGVINIGASNLSMIGGSQLSSGAHSFGAGGNISLVLSGGLNIAGQGTDMTGATVPSGVFTNAYDAGAGGQIDMVASTVALRQGGEISSSSRQGASGNAGIVNINTSQSVLVSGQLPRSGIYTNALGYGNAGGLTITSPLLTISDGGMVQSQNLISGAGGNINLDVKLLDVTSGGQISVDTRSSKAGGNINIANADMVNLTGNGSGIFAMTAVSIGNGGSINIGTKLLALNDSAVISADTSGSGMGGNITVIAADSVGMNGGASISAKSFFSGNGDAGTITIDAGSVMRMTDSSLRTSTTDAQGGNISIKARDLLYMQNARIISEAHVGAGNGGNITIDPILTVMNQSQIIANAFGGNGGNIAISTNTFLKSPDSIISASSRLGVNGTIIISSPVLDLSSQILSLPSLSGDLHIDNTACAASHKTARSSFGVLRASGWRPAANDLLSGFMATDSKPDALSFNGVQPFQMVSASDVLLNSCRN